MSVLIWIETITEYLFNYGSFSEFPSAAQHKHVDDFLLLKTLFITLVTYAVDDTSN